ncbi:MAG: peptidylprolyl isomerase [Faecalibacterium sp.]
MAEQNFDYSDPAYLLAEVNKAIAAVMVGGQSYKIGSRSLTRANITELRNLRADLAAQVENQEDNGLFQNTYAVFFEGR